MLRNRDDLYSAADYQPITDEHFLLRSCSPYDKWPEDQQEDYNDDWKDIQSMFH